MKITRIVALLASLLLFPATGAAQWLAFPVDYTGDTTPVEARALEAAVRAGVQASAQGADVFFAADDARWQGAADCTEPDCVREAAEAEWFSYGVLVRVVADAAIYELRVQVIDAETGNPVADEEDICIICESEEVAEQLQGLVVRMMEEAGPPPEREVVDVVVDVPSAPEPTPEETFEDDGSMPWRQGPYRLRFVFQPSEAVITVNGEPAGTGNLDMRAAEQVVEIRAEAEGFRTFSRRIRVDEQLGRSASYFIQLQPLPQEREVEVQERVVVERVARDGALYTAAPALLGAGVALTIGGAVLLAYDGKSACGSGVPRSQCAELIESGAIGGLLTGAGAAAIGAGTILLLLRQRGEESPQHSSRQPVLHVGTDRVHVGWQQQFR